MNPANLADAGKRHNHVGEFAALWQRCHQLRIPVHASYIIGFSHDTPESVTRDVQALAAAGADKASFYILTLIPGSEDYARAMVARYPPTVDCNRLDSFHANGTHPLMTSAVWESVFRRAWLQFYSAANMVAMLQRQDSRQARWNLLLDYVWYRWSIVTEHTHPMIAGLYRIRSFNDRRPGAVPLSFSRFLLQEGWRHLRYLGRGIAEFYRFQHVALEGDCFKTPAERKAELAGQLRGIRDWFRLTFGRVMSRKWLNNFWVAYGRNRWRLLFPWAYPWHIRLLPYALTEVVYTVRFALKFIRLRRFTAS